MDISNVFVIVGKNWTKERVVEELIAEKYLHNFAFSLDKTFIEMINILNVSDEVWVFGSCESLEIYQYAKRNGFEIWVMG